MNRKVTLPHILPLKYTFTSIPDVFFLSSGYFYGFAGYTHDWDPRLTPAAQGIEGAGPPQVAIGRSVGPKALRCGGTPGKPGFLRSKKCAQNFKNLRNIN
jgi:hypothetical protein